MFKNTTYAWYKKLKKPSFAPPSITFGIVWSVLYPIIFISFGFVFYLFFNGTIPFITLLPFIINLFSNLIFIHIQFKIKNNLLAAIDTLIIDISLIWGMILIFPYSSILAYVQIPYLLWVLFATVLQLSITYLNWG